MGSSILSINSCISSLRAQRQLATATSSLTSSFEKLSSGLRINKASDDAAGLAVASSLKADTRIYSQGVRNLNDGVSALNIADGALSNLSSIVIRMRELAEQSANGAVGWKQRKSLDAEAQALAKEYFRISRTADFNGLKLFDGSIQGLSLQAGQGSGGVILSSLGGAMGRGKFISATTYETDGWGSNAISMSDLNGDGILDMVTAGASGSGCATIRLGNGDGSFNSSVSYLTEGSISHALSMSDLNGDGILDMATAGAGGSGSATIRLGNGDGSFKSAISYLTEGSISYALSMSDLNGDGVLDMVTAGGAVGGGRATVRLGRGDGTFCEALSYETETNGTVGASLALSLSDLDNDGVLDIITAGRKSGASGSRAYATIRLGNGDGSFRAALSYETGDTGSASWSNALSLSDLNGDGALDLVAVGSSIGMPGAVRLGNGDGTFKVAQTAGRGEAVSMSDLDGDGIPDMVTAGSDASSGWTAIRLGNGDGSFKAALSYEAESDDSYALATADINGDGVVDLLTAGRGDSGDDAVTIRLSSTRDGISPILPFSLRTQADALQALPVFKGTLDRLSVQRGQIGAFQSRLSSALNTLSSTVLEYKGAQSRVEDVDIASESASLVRQQILRQAASSVLAQANQAPALALMLLNG